MVEDVEDTSAAGSSVIGLGGMKIFSLSGTSMLASFGSSMPGVPCNFMLVGLGLEISVSPTENFQIELDLLRQELGINFGFRL